MNLERLRIPLLIALQTIGQSLQSVLGKDNVSLVATRQIALEGINGFAPRTRDKQVVTSGRTEGHQRQWAMF